MVVESLLFVVSALLAPLAFYWIVRLGRFLSDGGNQGAAARTMAEMARAQELQLSLRPVDSARLEAMRDGLLNDVRKADQDYSAYLNDREADRFRVGGLSQSASVRGSNVFVNQSGSICGGDMVGGDLVKGSSNAGRCKYCGAAQ